MSFDSNLGQHIKHALVVTGCGAILFYFLYHGVAGDRGFIALSQLEYKAAIAKTNLEKIRAENNRIEARARLLRPDSLDLDMLDERARAMLGYTKPNEYVVLWGDKK